MGEKTRDQLLSEMLEVQKLLKEKVEHQDQMIRRFQMLTANEGLFSQIIDYCPYPIAVFTPQGILEAANTAFATGTGVSSKEVEDGRRNIFKCISIDVRLNNAIKQAFAGKTSFLESLKNPLSGSPEIKQKNKPKSKNYEKAIIFPISSDGGGVTHGVAIFIFIT